MIIPVGFKNDNPFKQVKFDQRWIRYFFAKSSNSSQKFYYGCLDMNAKNTPFGADFIKRVDGQLSIFMKLSIRIVENIVIGYWFFNTWNYEG